MLENGFRAKEREKGMEKGIPASELWVTKKIEEAIKPLETRIKNQSSKILTLEKKVKDLENQ